MKKLQVYLVTMIFSFHAVNAATVAQTVQEAFEAFFAIIGGIASAAIDSESLGGVIAFVVFLGIFFGVKALMQFVFTDGEGDLKGANAARTFVALAFSFIATIGLVQLSGGLANFETAAWKYLVSALVILALLSFAFFAIKQWIYGAWKDSLNDQFKFALSALIVLLTYFLIGAFMRQSSLFGNSFLDTFFEPGNHIFNFIIIALVIAIILFIIGALRQIKWNSDEDDKPDPSKFQNKEEYERAARKYRANKGKRRKIRRDFAALKDRLAKMRSRVTDKLESVKTQKKGNAIDSKERFVEKLQIVEDDLTTVKGLVVEAIRMAKEAEDNHVFEGERVGFRRFLNVLDYGRYLTKEQENPSTGDHPILTQIDEIIQVVKGTTTKVKNSAYLDKNRKYRSDFIKDLEELFRIWTLVDTRLGGQGRKGTAVKNDAKQFAVADHHNKQIQSTFSRMPDIANPVKQDFIKFMSEELKRNPRKHHAEGEKVTVDAYALYASVLEDFFIIIDQAHPSLSSETTQIILKSVINNTYKKYTWRSLNGNIKRTEIEKHFNSKLTKSLKIRKNFGTIKRFNNSQSFIQTLQFVESVEENLSFCKQAISNILSTQGTNFIENQFYNNINGAIKSSSYSNLGDFDILLQNYLDLLGYINDCANGRSELIPGRASEFSQLVYNFIDKYIYEDEKVKPLFNTKKLESDFMKNANVPSKLDFRNKFFH